MLLMYHHVCPQERVPAPREQSAIEGWRYNTEPVLFEHQLRELLQRGFDFVSMQDYVERCRTGQIGPRTISVTLDDGWLDNYEHALPVLEKLQIPACIFVVSRQIAEVRPGRRVTDSQMKEMVQRGVTFGGHSTSHHDLTRLPLSQLDAEMRQCKEELQQRIGVAVDYFAYPGGRFNENVVKATKRAGYRAACSVIGGGRNCRDSLYWLYRDTVTGRMSGLRDRLYLNPLLRTLLDLRARKRVASTLHAQSGSEELSA